MTRLTRGEADDDGVNVEEEHDGGEDDVNEDVDVGDDNDEDEQVT